MNDLYVLVWDSDLGNPIPPLDCNPSCEDQGMLVYRSLEAASLAAQHQTEMYAGDEQAAVAVKLSAVVKAMATP